MDKVLKYFIENPEKEFYVREIAKKENKSPTTISKVLKNYQKKKVLVSEEKLNHLMFRANSESIEYKLIKINHNLNKLYVSGLISYLESEFNYPSAIVLFGSFSKGEDGKESDVDIFLASNSKKEVDLTKYEMKIGRKVQLFVYSYSDIDRMKEKNKELLNNVLNGIVLSGFLEVFR